MSIPKRRELQYHKVTDQAIMERMDYIRQEFYKLYKVLMLNIPAGRSQSLALTALEDSQMRAIQQLALEYGEPQEFYYGEE